MFELWFSPQLSFIDMELYQVSTLWILKANVQTHSITDDCTPIHSNINLNTQTILDLWWWWGGVLSSTHAYTYTYAVDLPLSTLRSFIVSGMKDTEWLVLNPTQSSYTVMCCFAPWSSLSGASINRAIVRSALPKGFTPIPRAMWWCQSPIGLTFHSIWGRRANKSFGTLETFMEHNKIRFGSYFSCFSLIFF